MALEEAIALIKKTRPIIRIMPPQLEQLERFENQQRNALDESQEIPLWDREKPWEG
jgi:hypothetical protein